MGLIRLNHFLARAGVASRRGADELINQGKIRVNNQVIIRLGTKIEPQRDKVEFEGKEIKIETILVYYVLNKPVGVVSTALSQNGETPVTALVPQEPRVYPVGRLDKNSEGLIFLTNDGDLAYKLTHPKFGCLKTYRVLVNRKPNDQELRQLRTGVKLEEGMTSPADVKVGNNEGDSVWLTVKIHQGWNRQIRRMLIKYTITVRRLIRTQIGPINLGKLSPGEFRELTETEISRIL